MYFLCLAVNAPTCVRKVHVSMLVLVPIQISLAQRVVLQSISDTCDYTTGTSTTSLILDLVLKMYREPFQSPSKSRWSRCVAEEHADIRMGLRGLGSSDDEMLYLALCVC
jgi:hypothetical protein